MNGKNLVDVTITGKGENVTILAPAGAANTDAIHPTLSRRVTITKCLIDVGDDNAAIRNLTATSTRAAGVIIGLPESPV